MSPASCTNTRNDLLLVQRRAVACSISLSECVRNNGRGERIRTSDPLVPNQVLYQAEPLPELAVGKNVYELKGPWPSPS
jgi:hypothetical protein